LTIVIVIGNLINQSINQSINDYQSNVLMLIIIIILIIILLITIIDYSNSMISNKRIKGIIFDLDGTLIDTETLSTKAIQRCLDKYNVKFPGIELKRKILGKGGYDWTTMVINECGLVDTYEPSIFLNDWENNLSIICEEDGICKMNGAEEITSSLKTLNIPLVLLSSSS